MHRQTKLSRCFIFHNTQYNYNFSKMLRHRLHFHYNY